MNKAVSSGELCQQIRESEGTGYLNRTHQRSFSFNVFQMNTLELIEAVQKIKDPDQGIFLMMENNREAGLQAHRELNRHVHNFVSSSLTLVEHTRVFMRKYYAGTKLFETYEMQVMITFAKSPVAQFVQGLRNYMLHKGLPNSGMFIKFGANSGAIETGVQYDTVDLLDWKDWRPLARAYLEQAGEHLDIYEFTLEYLALVNQFHEWLDATLEMHHHSDLEELRQLQAQLQEINLIKEPIASVEPSDSLIIEPFKFTSVQTAQLEQISFELMRKIQEIQFKQTLKEFPTERPVSLITDSELIGPITFWGEDINGSLAFTFFTHNGKPYGFVEEDYELLENLIDAVMKVDWARISLSRKFVETAFFDWARRQFPIVHSSFPAGLSVTAQEKVTNVEVWAPIANLEVEKGFDFGPIHIEPITAAVMDNLRSRAPRPPAGQEQNVGQYFEKLRQDFQGYAAAIISIEAEPEFAVERAFEIARDAVNLLTFFSPAALRSDLFSPVALAGAEHIPTSKLIMLHEGGFGHNECVLPKHVGHWRLSTQKISALNSDLLETAGSLITLEGLSDFALAVRTSILTYCKGATFLTPKERLRSCLSALETILLRHDMEPRAYSIANRMSIILSRKGVDDEEAKKIIQQIYWLLEQTQPAELGNREKELIATFTTYAYNVLHVALGNIQNFHSKVQFVFEVDRMGISSGKLSD